MAGLEASVSRPKKWSMWAGSSTDLRAVLRIMENQYAPLLSAHVEKYTKSTVQQIVQYERLVASAASEDRRADLASTLASYKRRLEEEQREAEGANRIELALTKPDRSSHRVTGTADELSAYLEDKTFKTLEFEAPSGDIRNHRLTLSASAGDGLDIFVSSQSESWASAAFLSMSDEIERHVPKWRFLRGWVVLWVLFSIVGIVVWYVVFNAIGLALAGGTAREPYSSIAASGYIAFCFATPFIGSWLSRRALPAFQILKPGEKSNLGKVIAIFGSSVLAIVLALTANLISSVLL